MERFHRRHEYSRTKTDGTEHLCQVPGIRTKEIKYSKAGVNWYRINHFS